MNPLSLTLRTLGPIRLIGAGGELLPGRRKELVLLAYLARRAPRPIPRAELATLLWGERPDANARQSLRQALRRLKGVVDALQIGAETAALPLGVLDFDVVAFERDLEAGRLADAASRWEGDFLSGTEDAGGEAYRVWLETERQGLRMLLAWGLERLAEQAEGRGELDTARRWAERWAEAFPFEERPQARVIQTLQRAGRAGEARARHAAFVTRLRQELEIEPSADFQRLASGAALATSPPAPHPRGGRQEQQIRFCATADGVRIAYAAAGEGPTLIKAANWLSHVEVDWHSPMWRHWWEGLSRHHRFVRYDERGCGLSDWDAAHQSFESWVGDLEAVVDAAAPEQFALLGLSQGGAVAIAYAVRHPERVTHLILHGAYARGRLMRGTPEERERAELNIKLVRHGWGKSNPAFRHVFSRVFFPDAEPEQLSWFDEMQRLSASPENALEILRVTHEIDVLDVAPRVKAPTLVLHCADDAVVPFAEGRRLAALIPDARFVPLRSRNHIPLEGEPAWPEWLEALDGFLGVP